MPPVSSDTAAKTAFWSGLSLVMGGLAAVAIGALAPPAALGVAAGQFIGVGILAFTSGVGVLSAARTSPESTKEQREKTPAPTSGKQTTDDTKKD